MSLPDMPCTDRLLQVLRDGEWVLIAFEDMQEGELFRIWEPLVAENHLDSNQDVAVWKCLAKPNWEPACETWGCPADAYATKDGTLFVSPEEDVQQG